MDNVEENYFKVNDRDRALKESKAIQPDWKNPPTTYQLHADLDAAKPDHDLHVARVQQWRDNLNIEGNAKIKTPEGRSSVQPKMIRKQAEWRYGNLSEPFLSSPDVFDIKPITFEDKKGAEQNQVLLNSQFNTVLNKVYLVDNYIRAMVDDGTGVLKAGWELETIEEKRKEKIYSYVASRDPAYIQDMVNRIQFKKANPSAFYNMYPVGSYQEEEVRTSEEMGFPVMAVDTGETRETTETRILANHPTCDVVDSLNLYYDTTCNGVLEDAQFVIEAFQTTLAELRISGKDYHNLDGIPESSFDEPITSTDYYRGPEHDTMSFEDKDRQPIVAYEYWGNWDINDDGILVPIVATFIGNVMIRLERNPYPFNNHPYVAAALLPVRRSVMGEPDGELISDNQEIYGAVMRGMIDILARSANGQVGTAKGALDPVNKRRMKAGLDFEYNPTADPSRVFHMNTFPEIPQSALIMLQSITADAESLTGVKAFSDGMSSQALGDTATGIRGVLDAASKRELGILRRAATGMEQIARKIMAMNAVFLSEQEVIRVTNDEFVPIMRDDLQGNFDLSVSVSTAEQDDSQAAELAFMLQTTGQHMGPAFSQLIIAEIAKLRKMPALAKAVEEFQPQPDPLAQEKAMLEIELLKAQIRKENSIAIENESEVSVDQSTIALNNAKAREAHSKADEKDLGFVERENGTEHQRDLEKAGRQAAANLELKAAEATFADENARRQVARNAQLNAGNTGNQ